MERANRRAKDKETNDVFDFVFRNALGNIIILPDTPTSVQMKANTIGYFNNELFFKLANGELKKITVTDVA